MELKYKEVKIMCPAGYEQAVLDFALMKIDSIISQLTLAPTQAKKDEYQTKLEEAKAINKLSIKV